MDLKPVRNKHNNNRRIMVGDYKDCCRGHKGSWLCTKDGFEVWFRTEQECIDYIKRFKEYMEKKKTH